MLVEKKTASSTLKVALVGNPNSGKSSLFNLLTGLNQKVGNFPGVTVDKRTGTCHIHQGLTAEILDLPGTYSIYPRSVDEQVVFEVLDNEQGKDYPDVVVVVVDTTNLERSLLLFTQIKDLGLPVILVLNMSDVAQKRGIQVDVWALRKAFSDTPIVTMNARSGEGLEQFKAALQEPLHRGLATFFNAKEVVAPEIIEAIKTKCNIDNDYRAYQLLHQEAQAHYLPADLTQFITDIKSKNGFDIQAARTAETTGRFQQIQQILQASVKRQPPQPKAVHLPKN